MAIEYNLLPFVRAPARWDKHRRLVARTCAGLKSADISNARAALAAFLAGDDSAVLPWEALSHFAAARSHPARHGAILLPYDALLAAIGGGRADGGRP